MFIFICANLISTSFHAVLHHDKPEQINVNVVPIKSNRYFIYLIALKIILSCDKDLLRMMRLKMEQKK